MCLCETENLSRKKVSRKERERKMLGEEEDFFARVLLSGRNWFSVFHKLKLISKEEETHFVLRKEASSEAKRLCWGEDEN